MAGKGPGSLQTRSIVSGFSFQSVGVHINWYPCVNIMPALRW